MRLIHLDETGVSNKPMDEPYTIVAGVISDPDVHWKAIDYRLKELAYSYTPLNQQAKFYFHASDIFHGNPNGFFPRHKYDKKTRWKILDDLLQLPVEFNLDIFYGIEDRRNAAQEHPDLNANELSIVTHALAFGECISLADGYLREFTPDEVAILIMENRKEAHEAIKKMQHFLRNLEKCDNKLVKSPFPLQNIVESPFFASKTDSTMLQIADACAFALRRYWNKLPHAERFYGAIRPRVLVQPQFTLAYKSFVSGE